MLSGPGASLHIKSILKHGIWGKGKIDEVKVSYFLTQMSYLHVWAIFSELTNKDISLCN